MSDNDYRLIEAKFVVYYRKITEDKLDEERNDIYRVDTHDDSFNFLMAQNGIDASFDNLNRAFVVIMKEIDAKLNYLITLLRDGKEKEKFSNYTKAYACSVSANEINFTSIEPLAINDIISISFFLPISSHNEIKAIARVNNIYQNNNCLCINAKFIDINKKNQELIIYYGLVLDRERLKSRQLEL